MHFFIRKCDVVRQTVNSGKSGYMRHTVDYVNFTNLNKKDIIYERKINSNLSCC